MGTCTCTLQCTDKEVCILYCIVYYSIHTVRVHYKGHEMGICTVFVFVL